MLKRKQQLTGFILGIFLFAGAILPVTTFAQDYEDSPFGFIQGEYGENDDGKQYIVDLGVHWDKMFQPMAKLIFNPDSSIDFSGQDEVVRWLVIEQGLNIPLSIPIFIEGEQLTHDEYENLCEALIEHYDGDGINDMDGSPVIKYWNVGFTEMNRGVAQGVPINERAWKLTEVETAEYVKIGYDCIKNMHSEFQVILGGSAGILTWQEGEPDEYYYNLISELTGNQQCPDIIFDYHQGSNPTKFKVQIEAMNIVKETLNNFGYTDNEIWTTDVGGSWDGLGGFTEKEHAGDVVRRYAYTIANGQKKLFWTRIVEYDWTDDDSSIFDFMGLVNNPLNTDGKDWKKLAYYTYKLMVEKLEGSDWSNIETIIEDLDNKYAYKFINDSTGEPIYVAWWDYFEDPAYTIGDSSLITLTGISSNQVIVTDAVPNDTSGIYITDYNTAFQIDTLNVTSGSVSFYLKESPVFIEEISTTSIEETGGSIPDKFQLNQNYPNPFNPQTTISYQLPICNKVSLKVYDILGQEVRTLVNENKSAGYHSVVWDGADNSGRRVSSGVYFYSLELDHNFSQVKKLLLLK